MSKDDLSKMIGEAVEVAISKATQKKSRKLTRKEVCEILHISLPTLHNYINRGLITPERIGRRVLFDSEEVEEAVSKEKIVKFKHKEA